MSHPHNHSARMSDYPNLVTAHFCCTIDCCIRLDASAIESLISGNSGDGAT